MLVIDMINILIKLPPHMPIVKAVMEAKNQKFVDFSREELKFLYLIAEGEVSPGRFYYKDGYNGHSIKGLVIDNRCKNITPLKKRK